MRLWQRFLRWLNPPDTRRRGFVCTDIGFRLEVIEIRRNEELKLSLVTPISGYGHEEPRGVWIETAQVRWVDKGVK